MQLTFCFSKQMLLADLDDAVGVQSSDSIRDRLCEAPEWKSGVKIPNKNSTIPNQLVLPPRESGSSPSEAAGGVPSLPPQAACRGQMTPFPIPSSLLWNVPLPFPWVHKGW